MNKYYDISDSINASEELGIDKDKAVQSVTIEKNTGVNREDVHSNFEDVFKFDANKTEIRATPLLAKYSKKSPINAAIIKQDVSVFSEIERLANKTKYAIPKSIVGTNLGTDYFDLMNYDNGVQSFTTIDNDMARNDVVDRIGNNTLKLQNYSKYDSDVNGDADSFGYRALPEVVGLIGQVGYAPFKEPAATATGAVVGGTIGSAVPLLGTLAGAATGAMQASSALSNFKVTAGNVYNDSVYNQPKDIKDKINKQEAYAISMVAGVISGGIEFLPAGKLFGKAFKGINLQNVAWKELAQQGSKSNLGKAVLYAWNEFKEQGLPEYFQNITEDVAKVTIDPNKQLTLGEFANIATSKESLEAAALGTLAGPTIQGSATIAKTGIGVLRSSPLLSNERGSVGDVPQDGKPTKKEIKFILKQEVEQDKVQVKEKSDALKTLIEVKKKSTIQDSKVIGEIQDHVIPDTNNYILKEELFKLSENNKSFKGAFERITDQQVSDDKETYTVSDRQLVDLVKYNQDVLNNFRITPEGNTQSNYDVFVGKLEENKQKVSDVLGKLDLPELTPDERAAITSDITSTLEGTTEGVYNAESRNEQPIFTPNIVEALPENEVAQITTEVNEARAQVAEATVKARQKQIDKIVSLDYKVEIDERLQEIEKQLDEDKTGQLVIEKQFDPNNVIEIDVLQALRFIVPDSKNKSQELLVDDIKSRHQSAGFSALAIDPTTLPDNLKNLFTSKSNTRSKKRVTDKKVFVKGGLNFKDLNPLARALGFKNQNELVENLAMRPSRQELLDFKTENASIEQYDESLNDFGADKNDFLDAFSNKAKIHLKEIYTVMREKTGTARLLIKKLGRIQTIESMKVQSKALTRKLKVRELNPAIYRRNQNNFMKKAADALVKGDFLNFFSNKEKQALNTLLEADVQRAISVLNNKYRKLAKLFRKDTQQLLAEAGQDYVDLFDTLRGAIEFNPNKKPITQDKLRILEPLIQAGYAIPEALFEMKDAKIHVGDMTFDQTVALVDTMINVVAAAKEAKSLYLKTQVLDTLDVETIIQETIGNRADRNEENYNEYIIESNKDKGLIKDRWEKTTDIIGGFVHSITNFNNIMDSLTLGEEGTIFHDTFIDPLKDSEIEKSSELTTWHDYLGVMSKILNTNFQVYTTEKITIPEFNHRFKDGVITKGHLIGMMGQLGHNNGIQVLEKDLKLTIDQITPIIERYTKVEDAKIVQSIHNYFDKVRWPKIVERHKKLGLAVPEKVPAKPYVIHGITIKGGYFPISRKQTIMERLQRQASDWVNIIKGDNILDKLYTSVLNTFSGSDIERVQNANGQIDYSFNGLEQSVKEMIHNNAYSVTMRNIGKMLSNESIQKNMINILGMRQFSQLLSHLERTANNKFENMSMFERDMNSITNWAVKNLYVSYLGSAYLLKPMTSIKQLFSAVPMLVHLVQKSGNLGKSIAYLSSATFDRSIVSQKDKFKIIEFIAKRSPQMRNMLNHVKDIYGITTLDFINLDERFKFDEQGNKITKNIDKLKNLSLGYLTYIQMDLNMRMYVAGYRMAMDGSIEGVNKGDSEAALRFADSSVERTLSNANPLLKSTFQEDHPNWMFAGSQRLLLFQGVYSAIDIGNRKGKITPSEKWTAYATAMSVALLWGSSSSILSLALEQMSNDEEDKDKKKELSTAAKYGYATIFGTVDNIPFLSTVKNGIDYVYLKGGNPDNFVIADPVISLAMDTGKVFMSAIKEGEKFSKSDYKRLANVIRGSQGIPRTGTQWLVDLLVPTTKKKSGVVNEGIYGDDPISPYEVMRSEEDKTQEDPVKEKKSIVDELNDTIKSLIGSENKHNSKALLFIRNNAVRDITNPEGGEINSIYKGEKTTIELSNKEHDEAMIMIDAISRLETADHALVFNVPKNGTAAGFHQFIQGTWSGIRAKYPELDLPKEVKTASKYQQYAAQWKIMGEHFALMTETKVARTIENVYMVHMLNPDTFKFFMGLHDNVDLMDEDVASRLHVHSNPRIYYNKDSVGNYTIRSKKLTKGQMLQRLRGDLLVYANKAIEYASDNDYLTYVQP